MSSVSSAATNPLTQNQAWGVDLIRADALLAITNDLLGSTRGISRSMTLPDAMEQIAEEGGVLVLLGKEEDLESQLQRFAAEDRGEQPVGKNWQGSSRTVGVGSQILAAMGVQKMRLLSKPIKYHALSGFGLEVVEYIHD